MRKHGRSIPFTFILTTLLTGGLSSAAPIIEPAPQEAARSDAYRAGRRALEAENWSEAVDRFADAVSQKGDDADAALYWQAYALQRLNRSSRAQLALEQLYESYPESRWIDDARALEIEVRGSDRRPTDPETVADEELKLIALNALVHLEWERARPHLQKFIASDASPKMRERALFVLSQSDAPEARRMLLAVASDVNSPELAGEAVQYLAYYDDDETLGMLRELYKKTPHLEVKEDVLEAMMMAHDVQGILAIARSEPNEELRESAVEQLGFLDARNELRQLYKTEASLEVKEQILEAFMYADDQATLLELARTEPNEELREAAIEQLGHLGAVAELRQIYANESSAELREEIAEALWYAGDLEFLVRIARNDEDEDVREQAIEAIGFTGTPEARQALSTLYRESSDIESKKDILEAFAYQDDPAPLIEIARTETNLELRREAIEVLTMMDSEAATEFLLGILGEE